jgi:arylsulfatase A
MISYLDKNVGKLINKVQSSGLANNTVIIFTSDNATNNSISSIYKGESVNGTKGTTTFDGTNVPLLIYAPGIISLPGSIDTSLVDMTDFFPTIADIAKTSLTAWKPLDGVTFYDNIIGTPLKQRSYDYCYWPQYFRTEPPFSYVFDYNYKLYDSLSGGNFYRINIDRNEEHPIPNKQLTNDEKKIKNKFQRILNQSHP